MIKEILFIRHTSVKYPRGYCYGFSDIDVSDTFEEECEKLKKRIQSFKPTKVISSPLKRCKLLAEKVFENSKIHTNNNLKELNYGDWENLTWESIGVPEKGDWMYKYPSKKTPNGESFEDMKIRVCKVFENELTKFDDQKIAIVCHGGVIKAILSHILKIPLESTINFKVHYTGTIKLIKENNKWKLAHLDSALSN